ncbi:MAG: Fic family protein [Dehalococcoidia bacterium]
MELSDFRDPPGRIIERSSPSSGRVYNAYVPNPLPPEGQEAAIAANTLLLAEATHAVGQLDGIATFMPNPMLLVEPYMRREAVLSSRIEGLHTTHAELATLEAMGELSQIGDARDVHNYVVALEYGLRHVQENGLSRALVETIHRKLLQGARGEPFSGPGEFRTVQNHIGNTRDHDLARFVPPPPDEMQAALDAFFRFLTDGGARIPALVEAAWVHYQFETIHPFLDGNGRVGRVLIPLLLAWRNQLKHPLLYLSPYFERNRTAYYDLLYSVSAAGSWSAWLRFFLTGVREQADESARLSRAIIDLGLDWQQRLTGHRATANAQRLAQHVLQFVAVDAKAAGRFLEVTPQTAYKSIEALVEVGILEEVTGRPWGRVFLSPELRVLLD